MSNPNNTDREKLIVIGNGMVGHAFVEKLIEADGLARFDVTVFGEEPRAAYDRVHLSEYFSGRSAEDLALTTAEDYRREGIDLHLDDPVVEIDTDNREVVTRAGQRCGYDRLMLATGSYAFVPPIEGRDRDGCLVYRTIEDLDAIRAHAESGRRGVVVGGGLLGLEAANALKNLGLETHVVEFAPQLMPAQLDLAGGDMLRRQIEALDVQVHTGKATQLIDAGESHKLRMNFAEGDPLETDIVLFSAGIRPRDELARSSGIAVGERGGIVIDDQCRTSDPAIFAIGECALWNSQVFGLVGPGYAMADVAVKQLVGTDESAAFTGADMSTKLKLLGVEVGSIGDAHARTPGAQTYATINEPDATYKRLVVLDDKLIGAVLVGDTADYDTLLQYALNGLDLPEHPESLIAPAGDGAPALGPDALPETATICSCHNVTKGGIIEAIDGGCVNLADVKGVTKASTGCGGCAALLKSTVDSELGKRGMEVNTDICEHFPHTRAELYHLVRVEGIRSFGELLERHGRGHGCDICKPAAASIFASVWNEHVLEPMHQPLQDTNDTYLANMQKDGTYSIVPRVPAGEITAEKLIVLGNVAQKYGLYTKITGGQRIDLFGARKEQLPPIWEELIAAGFETGHAYGKSVRTVKSCVGSTWCRYGVQDSVGMAIHIENRYKGLRSPHKLKFAVSGCTRECAEAQSKDIGVIATENGWNLYVCGNGGMKPRHADLFATDLDDEQLIRYIDRVLMFYIKTADRLQRTSVWLENLEGGLDYLREVVIDDRLGIGAELEEQMQAVVDSYQCEWKSTLADPAKLKRFRSFVNSDAPDDNVLFVEERGQVRPATPEEKRERAGIETLAEEA
ncbi:MULTISPECIES: nitrite reductase large subunit NirB [unclassified Guyparkeria]|uniref:nitrite reductase large subunit NirB n=1 Tax=unclassified Guyparkeria TaxID=2626246 RepID=UPI000733A11B|nr:MULTISPECIES: nitrite reductase large subunit NirB [unclassified Guyparkeria]KTG16193.1 nitrite reductase [Guyparkeria sp. XI15]OAE85044.1 nitrite reductase [Guyparkeria sp. WRN-7]